MEADRAGVAQTQISGCTHENLAPRKIMEAMRTVRRKARLVSEMSQITNDTWNEQARKSQHQRRLDIRHVIIVDQSDSSLRMTMADQSRESVCWKSEIFSCFVPFYKVSVKSTACQKDISLGPVAVLEVRLFLVHF